MDSCIPQGPVDEINTSLWAGALVRLKNDEDRQADRWYWERQLNQQLRLYVFTDFVRHVQREDPAFFERWQLQAVKDRLA